jgi:hypothetical protein
VQRPTETIQTVLSYCTEHREALPAEERARLDQERRDGCISDVVGVLIKLAFYGLLAFMAWYVWQALR